MGYVFETKEQFGHFVSEVIKFEETQKKYKN